MIAVENDNKDICFFKASTNPSAGFWPAISPNTEYVVFTSNQFITDYEVIQHLFIVNAIDGSYVRFVPENPEEDIEALGWSPDSSNLAFASYANCCTYPNDAWMNLVYLNLIDLNGELIWQVSLSTEGGYHWGYLEWTESGEQISYGHAESSILGIGAGQPFLCTINQDGTNLSCKELPYE